MASRVAILVSCALLLAATWQGAAAAGPRLRVGYYSKKCPAAEYIVKGVVGKALQQNPGLGAGIIRMAFHDCFVQVRAPS
jgi:peroxidase